MIEGEHFDHNTSPSHEIDVSAVCCFPASAPLLCVSLSFILLLNSVISETATWWYDNRTEQKDNLPPMESSQRLLLSGSLHHYCTRKQRFTFSLFRLMIEGENFDHNRRYVEKYYAKNKWNNISWFEQQLTWWKKFRVARFPINFELTSSSE